MASTAWLACLTLAAASGCRIHTDFDDTVFACSAAAPQCPPGLECDGTTCVEETPPADGGADGRADAGETCQPADNDGCGDAIDLTAAALAAGGTTVYGDTTGYAGDLAPSVLPGCTESPEPGPDAIYELTAQTGDMLHVELTPEGWNGAVYLIDACSPTAACLGGDDAPGAGSIDEADIAIAANDTYYLIVDSSTTSGAGCYELAVALVR